MSVKQYMNLLYIYYLPADATWEIQIIHVDPQQVNKMKLKEKALTFEAGVIRGYQHTPTLNRVVLENPDV